MAKLKESVRDDLIRVRYKGYVVIVDVLDTVRDFLKTHKFDVFEPKYKWKRDDGEFKIKAEKKLNDYYKYHITIECNIFVLRRDEVIEDGKKVKKDYSKVDMRITAEYEADYDNRFTGPWKSLQKALDRPGTGIQFGTLEGEIKIGLQSLLQEFVEYMKKFFNMEATG